MVRGRNFANLSVVIHAPPLVFKAIDLYLMLSKKVKSSELALCSGLILFILKSFFKGMSLKIWLIFTFFWTKKTCCHSSLVEAY